MPTIEVNKMEVSIVEKIDCLLIGYFGGDLNFDKPKAKHALIDVDMKEFNAAVAYLGTFLHRRGFSFDYINYIEDEYDLFVKKLNNKNIKSVAISTTYCLDNETVKKLVNIVRNIDPTVKIILGGPHIANLLKYTNDKEILNIMLRRINADFYVNSFQGETALVNILLSLRGDLPTNQVANIYYRSENKYMSTETYEEDNLLEENMVDWSLFADRVSEVVPVRTAISCPFSCAYCNHPINAGTYRFVSVEAIEKELNSINNIQKIRYVDFVDDTFNVPQKRFKDILRMIIKNKYNFKWFSYIRCQFIDDETVKLMKESGCMGSILGIESGSPEMLKRMNKLVTVEELRRGVDLLNQYNIPTAALFFIGFPGETPDTVNQTIRFIEEIKPTFYDTQPWFYDPRTPISKQSDRYEIKGFMHKWSHSTMNSSEAEQLVKETILSIKNSRLAKYTAPQMDKLLSSGLTIEQIYDMCHTL